MEDSNIDNALAAASIAEAEGHSGTAAAFLRMVKTMQRNLQPLPSFDIEKTTPPTNFNL